ncbi:MAG: Crp/Fnr family transcriptional regulator [Burkholderiaceae bacterium]|nr:Crp/Fnr family transcriptional regulator [Rhodoferax sp.]MCZ4315675.1 Crp/Fnr family transcriptional regulator [Comamonadaceae bacterium G21597-S1]MCB2004092.1 Crp/Fnr family transcriptional regulator [Rhodoferax sp.]MCB2027918.1 Crp/Fnr family transcriptional regulator [Rhodoferax sp.]MCB2039347.1 Crp/Fnr family transcriptional regulator [Rhodoferax sp.]
MSLEQEVELIRRFPIFSKIAPAKQKLLCFSSERLTYSPGQEIFHMRDPGDACYVVIEGDVQISVDRPNGQAPLSLGTVGRNGIVGEIAIFGQVPRTATATAATRVEVLRISAELFRSVIRENPDAAIELIRNLAERLANTTAILTRQSGSAS